MKLIIVAAPTSVIFDQALPLIVSLKKEHPSLEILCLYPNPGSIIGARPGWTPIQWLEELGATSAYPIAPNRWMPSDQLTIPAGVSKFLAKASRLTFPHLYRMGRVSRLLVSLGLSILVSVSEGRIPRKITSITQGSNCVIWDATLAAKEYMNPLMYLFQNLPSYSIRHGIGILEDPKKICQSWRAPEQSISDNVTVFAMASEDIAELQKTIGVSKRQIVATGIYRHHPDWIRAIASHEHESENIENKEALLIVSRGWSSDTRYLPRERMLGYLQDIKTVAQRLNLSVIVKPHPKETDLSVHEEAFGSASKGLNWEISDDHLAILSKRAMFAVCFFSGSCLDLTAYGVPTIERLDLVGLAAYDIPSAIRNSKGEPILEYRQHGHVIGSTSSEEFFLRVEEVMRDRPKVMQELKQAYSRQFFTPPMNPKDLAQQISNSCSDFSDSQSSS